MAKKPGKRRGIKVWHDSVLIMVDKIKIVHDMPCAVIEKKAKKTNGQKSGTTSERSCNN